MTAKVIAHIQQFHQWQLGRELRSEGVKSKAWAFHDRKTLTDNQTSTQTTGDSTLQKRAHMDAASSIQGTTVTGAALAFRKTAPRIE